MVTAWLTSESVSNPSTNSPMIRSTRHESVLVKGRRSRGTWERSLSSSVTAVRGELLERCDMVVLHVIEERGEAHVPRARIGDDAGAGEESDARRRIGCRQHDDRRALFGARRDVGQEPELACPPDQVFGELGGRPPDGPDPDLLDVVETTELGVHRRQRRGAEPEAARGVR